MAKTVNKSRNFTLAGGVQRYSRSALYKLKGAHKHKYPAVAPKAAKATTKTVTFGKGTRTISTKKTVRLNALHHPLLTCLKPKVYDVAQKAAVIVKRKAAPIKLRSSIKPGSVLIVLSGRYSGKVRCC
jgi:large subunit ribosomal protein L6e